MPSTVDTLETLALGKWSNSNPRLDKIINRTGKSFTWSTIVGTSGNKKQEFVTGTIETNYGNVLVTSE